MARRRKCKPLTPEQVEQVKAEINAEVEFEEAEWWPVGLPLPDARRAQIPHGMSADFEEEDDLPF